MLLLVAAAGVSAGDDVGGAAPGPGEKAGTEASPALNDSEREQLLSLIEPESRPQMSRPPEPAVPDLNRELARQIAEAQRKLSDARERDPGSSRSETLALAQELLDVARARLLNDPSVDDARARQRIAEAMDNAQRRIDALRIMAARSPEAGRLNAQLDQLQERLDIARQGFASDTEDAAAPPGHEQTERIYALAQQRLDEAYAKAATLPNAAHLIEQLDAAQQRLNEARAGFEARSATAGD